jgi:ribosome maturation factor RimP
MAQRGRGTAAEAGAARSRASARTPETSDQYDHSGPPLRPQELAVVRNRLRSLVEPVVTAEGLDLEDVTVSRAGRRYVVRITVDADSGIGHDELSDVSRAISASLDEAERAAGELTPGAYTLELSSPGVDRPLTLPRHWRRNIGRLVTVKAGGRQLTGRIMSASDVGVSLDVNGKPTEVAFAELGSGRIQVEFAKLAELIDDEIGPEIIDGDEAATDTAATDTELEDES